MQIIPVIDLKDGLVVHAIRGDRANYQPIHHVSQLTASSDLEEVINGFLQLHPFKVFYIADLNAILNCGNHKSLIHQLAESRPDLHFWMDNGSQLSEPGNEPINIKTVIGTESQHLPPQQINQDFILSLDYQDQQTSGLKAWFEDSQYWPNTVIAMTLNKVGSNSGPDWETLNHLRNTHPDKQIVAAGGVRNSQDLIKLRSLGIHAVLLATALHNGAISAAEIKKL